MTHVRRIASWLQWTTSTRIRSSTRGLTNSIKPPDMIRTLETMNEAAGLTKPALTQMTALEARLWANQAGQGCTRTSVQTSPSHGKAHGGHAKVWNRTREIWLSGSASSKNWCVQQETSLPGQKSGAP